MLLIYFECKLVYRMFENRKLLAIACTRLSNFACFSKLLLWLIFVVFPGLKHIDNNLLLMLIPCYCWTLLAIAAFAQKWKTLLKTNWKIWILLLRITLTYIFSSIFLLLENPIGLQSYTLLPQPLCYASNKNFCYAFLRILFKVYLYIRYIWYINIDTDIISYILFLSDFCAKLFPFVYDGFRLLNCQTITFHNKPILPHIQRDCKVTIAIK